MFFFNFVREFFAKKLSYLLQSNRQSLSVRVSTTFENFLGQKELKLVALHTLKHNRPTVSMIPAILLVGNKKTRERSLISMSLAVAGTETKEKSR